MHVYQNTKWISSGPDGGKRPGLQRPSGPADRQADVQTEFFCEAGGCCVWALLSRHCAMEIRSRLCNGVWCFRGRGGRGRQGDRFYISKARRQTGREGTSGVAIDSHTS